MSTTMSIFLGWFSTAYEWAFTGILITVLAISLEEKIKIVFFAETPNEKYISADFIKVALHWLLPVFVSLSIVKTIVFPFDVGFHISGVNLQQTLGIWYGVVILLMWLSTVYLVSKWGVYKENSPTQVAVPLLFKYRLKLFTLPPAIVWWPPKPIGGAIIIELGFDRIPREQQSERTPEGPGHVSVPSYDLVDVAVNFGLVYQIINPYMASTWADIAELHKQVVNLVDRRVRWFVALHHSEDVIHVTGVASEFIMGSLERIWQFMYLNQTTPEKRLLPDGYWNQDEATRMAQFRTQKVPNINDPEEIAKLFAEYTAEIVDGYDRILNQFNEDFTEGLESIGVEVYNAAVDDFDLPPKVVRAMEERQIARVEKETLHQAAEGLIDADKALADHFHQTDEKDRVAMLLTSRGDATAFHFLGNSDPLKAAAAIVGGTLTNNSNGGKGGSKDAKSTK